MNLKYKELFETESATDSIESISESIEYFESKLIKRVNYNSVGKNDTRIIVWMSTI